MKPSTMFSQFTSKTFVVGCVLTVSVVAHHFGRALRADGRGYVVDVDDVVALKYWWLVT
jgi:hypothetical protein